MKLLKKLGLFVAVSAPIAAHAALPAAATQAFTDLSTDGGSIVSLVWGVAVVVAGGLALVGMFKKGIGKAF